jgi:putative hydrolase of the HAD superfamily
MHTKAIFFDLYQTLINVDANGEKEGKEAGFEKVIVPYLLQRGASKPDASLVLSHYSDDLMTFYKGHDAELLQHSFPAILSGVFTKYYSLDVPEAEMSGLLYEFRKISRGHLMLYEGAREALEVLSAQYTLAVASHTQSVYTERELEELNILRYFRHRIYSSDIGFKKRSDDFYRKCLEAVSLDPKDCAMVGDNLYEDVYMANRNGMHTVWVINPLTKGENVAAIEPEASLPIESLGILPGVIARILG